MTVSPAPGGADVAALAGAFPTGVFPAGCPSRVLLDHVTSKWGVLVIVSLADRPHRWSELRRRADGISEKMLAQTLRTLEADGFVHREQQPVIPPRVDYSLTDRGERLAELLVPLLGQVARWAGDGQLPTAGNVQVPSRIS